MFNQKRTRTQVAVLAVVAMLVLAGCSTSSNPGTEIETEPQEPTTTATPQEEEKEEKGTDDTTTADNGPGAGQNLTDYSNERGVGSAGLTPAEQDQVQELVVGFYDDLPENELERRERFLDTADELCKKDQQHTGAVKTSMLENGGTATDQTIRRAEYAAQIANEFDDQVPVKPLKDVHSSTGDVTKYAPLLGSYNQMSDAACVASEERTDAAIKEPQIATMMFGVDAVLISTGVFYQPAFVGTRFVANKASHLGLYRLRYMCGDRCWAFAMSEVHVALRGSLVTGTSNLLRQAGEMGVELDRVDLEAVANEYDADVDSMLETMDTSTAADAFDSATDDVVECSEAAVESGKEESEAGDGGLLGGGGIDSVAVVEKGEEALNKSTEVVEECRDAGR